MLSRIKYLRQRYAISFCARTIFRFSVFLLLVFDFYLKKKLPFKHIRIPELLSDKWEFFGYLLTGFNKNDAMIQTARSYGILFHSIQFEHTIFGWLVRGNLKHRHYFKPIECARSNKIRWLALFPSSVCLVMFVVPFFSLPHKKIDLDLKILCDVVHAREKKKRQSNLSQNPRFYSFGNKPTIFWSAFLLTLLKMPFKFRLFFSK